MNQIANHSQNIVLPWPKSIAIERSGIEKGISSIKTLVNKLIYRTSTPKSPDSYNNIVLIGIHGWFPGKILKTGIFETVKLSYW